MATSTLMEKQRKALLKKFHTLLGVAGIGEAGKREILASYGVVSSRDMDAKDLLEVCDKLDMIIHPEKVEIDKWRKRVLAVMLEWRRLVGQDENMSYVKAVAARAASVDHFNAISKQKLINLYNNFKEKNKQLRYINKLTVDELEIASWVN